MVPLQVVQGDPNGEVFIPIVVEVTGGQRSTEVVVHFANLEDAFAVLVPNLVAGGRQPGGAAINYVDRAGTTVPPDDLQRDPNRQVFNAIVVEVTGGQRITKKVRVFGPPGNTVTVLVPNLVAGGLQAGEAAVNHVDCASIFFPPDVLALNPNGQVCKAIVVEVTRGQRPTKLVNRFGLPGNPVTVLAPKLVSLTRELCHGLAGGQNQNGHEISHHGANGALCFLGFTLVDSHSRPPSLLPFGSGRRSFRCK